MPESPLLVTRFAPSPTGELHLGNVRTALFNALLAWHGGGRFRLRIEDTDASRSKSEFTTALQRDLAWLGIHWHRQLFAGAASAAGDNDFAAMVAAAKSATGLKGPSLFKPLRAALTGRLAGPELGPLLKAMPAGSAQARLTRYASSQNP